MAVFGRTREPGAGAMSGERGPAVPSSLGDRETGGAEVNTGLAKVKEEIQSLREGINAFIKTVITLCKEVAAFSRPIYISVGKEKERRRRRKEKRARREEKEVREELRRRRERKRL